VSGAMDSFALRVGNRLVGNPDGAAALELTVNGPELLFETEAVIAVTGADLSTKIDAAPVPLWTALRATRGATLSFGERRRGARAYLAVAGGIEVPVVLGSRATHLPSQTGGFAGRALAEDDQVVGGPPPPGAATRIGQVVSTSLLPQYGSAPTVRVVLGPQAEGFSTEAIEALEGGRYTVSPQSDRMGYRLIGPPLVHVGSTEMVSDATPAGALQVPANRQPILLMADCQTTGGYPKIAVVISADLPLAAQLLPDDTISFSIIKVPEAQAIAREHRARLAAAFQAVS
ncbi:MAG: biotin-dependent carboxyltransferase family protein, partial [Nitrospiraceae bacterium]